MKAMNGVLVAVAALSCFTAFGSGFGLYQASTKGHALGGAVLGRAVDASANFFNPATLSDLTNATVTIGGVTEHPRARMKVEGTEGSATMDAGAFFLPHFGVAVPLPGDFTFGLGGLPEYGLGSEYSRAWPLANSSTETTVTSFTLNPNLAYALNEALSFAVGARLVFFDFEQFSSPMGAAYPVRHRLKGDNGMADCGWQAGVRYRLRDDFAVGLIYKSTTRVHVDGKSSVTSPAGRTTVPAETMLELPDSVTGGFNWDITDTWHLGGSMMWTQWSTVSTLDFNLGGNHTPCVLRWDDTYRFTLAPSWDFAEDWTLLASYGYETDCCGGQDSTMLPATERHMLGSGLAWRFSENLEIALSYGLILMDGRTSHAKGLTYAPHRGLSHAVGMSLTYTF